MANRLIKAVIHMLPKDWANVMGILFNKKLQYNQDGLITYHTCNFRKDKDFIRSREISKKETGFPDDLDWRLHTVLWAAKQCSHLEGDFVECGVNQGFLMRAVVEYINFDKLKKKMYLLDTFEGIPIDYVSEEEKRINDHFANNFFLGDFQKVKHVFRNFKNVEFVKGKIPETLSQVKSKKIAFMSIDLNNAYPEIEAMKYFWDKMVPGGIIILDDYAYSTNYVIQRREWDKLSREMDFDILTLATGQGMIIKGNSRKV